MKSLGGFSNQYETKYYENVLAIETNTCISLNGKRILIIFCLVLIWKATRLLYICICLYIDLGIKQSLY